MPLRWKPFLVCVNVERNFCQNDKTMRLLDVSVKKFLAQVVSDESALKIYYDVLP